MNIIYLIIIPLAFIFFIRFKQTAPVRRNICIKVLTVLLLLMPFFQNVNAQWTNQSSGTSANIVSVYFLNTLTGWAAGETGYIARTTNGGINWVQQSSPTSNALISIIFIDSSTGWISGTFGTVIKTTNGGVNWTSLSTGISGALRISFVNAQTGWTVGASGTILKTTNGGSNWNVQTSGTTSFLLNVRFMDSNTGYICGQSGVILKTTNSGINWSSQTTGLTQNLYGLSFSNSNTCWVSGENGNILYTTNGGSNWSLQSAGTTDDFYSVFFVNPNTGWVAGVNGKIYLTQNAGNNWVQQTTSTTSDINTIHFPAQQTGWAVGSNGKIIVTTTGGVTVPGAPTLSSPANNSTGITLMPSLQWFSVIGAVSYHLLLSTDSNFTTTIINDSTLTGLAYNVPNGLLQNNTKYFWRIRGKGTSGYGPFSSRWNFTTENLTGISQSNNEIPKEYSLWQNYPNPFNPVTNIKFSLPEAGYVKLNVYDMLGREIETLVNDNVNAGTHIAEWNASNQPSGVYFYKLQAGEFSEIRKMVLVK